MLMNHKIFTFAGFDELSEAPVLCCSFSKLDLTGILADLKLTVIWYKRNG